MHKINFREDFDFFLDILDAKGQSVGIPTFDWCLHLSTLPMGAVFKAEFRGGVYRNCRVDNGRIHVFCNGHGLPPGSLKLDFHAWLPDDRYDDGSRFVAATFGAPVELVRGPGSRPTGMEIDMMAPYIKGADGHSPVIRDGRWWVWDDVAGDYADSGQLASADIRAITAEELAEIFDEVFDSDDSSESVV